jgi:hypothetical protein
MEKNSRRHFLKTTAAATAALTAVDLFPGSISAKENTRGVAIILNPEDAAQKPAAWAAAELRDALKSRGAAAEIFPSLEQAPPGFDCVVAATSDSAGGKEALAATKLSLPQSPEAVGLARGTIGKHRALLAAGSDARGLAYALLELTDRIHHAANPLAELSRVQRTVEKPANRIRSNCRLFASDVEDKPWFNDREMWPRYLTMLATNRFNRFNLGLGLGYDFLQDVTDAYFLFAYPFLLSVPGYDVRAEGLPDAERDRNLEMLRFISDETAARGLQFQLGIWMHGYVWENTTRANYRITGLSKQNHAAYCSDAICALLKACPAISGVTLRTHGESGVTEGSYDFWKAVFNGVGKCGRSVEIDLHPKGIDDTMINNALATGMPVKVSPKFWAEHLGMAYHQAEIRELERPTGRDGSGLMKLSSGSRSFLRYGYGDLLKENRRYGIIHRIWPGTQRLLIWGDPQTGAAYGRAFSFCGSDGAEFMEPLTFKGRRGSGIAGDRCGYADTSLKPRWDWQKYLYTFRMWGRMMYNPDSNPDVWQRPLQKDFGRGAPSAELALANASRILPIITTAHLPSAANNNYWPEMYINQSIIDLHLGHSYSDTPAPKIFGNVSPLDPQLFSRINDYAGELLKSERSGKYTPVEVAQWLEDYAAAAAKNLAEFERKASDKTMPEFRRLIVDLKIQIGLGRFFGAKFRSGVLYGLFDQSGDTTALSEAIKAYRRARHAWAELANASGNAYMTDITIGELPQLRGHWSDRLPLIDRDIAAMEEKAAHTGDKKIPNMKALIQEVTGRPKRAAIAAHHVPPATLRQGEPLNIELTLEKSPQSVRLYYRHVNQGERFESISMQTDGKRFEAIIPAAYVESPYPLQYYFEITRDPQNITLHPVSAQTSHSNRTMLCVELKSGFMRLQLVGRVPSRAERRYEPAHPKPHPLPFVDHTPHHRARNFKVASGSPSAETVTVIGPASRALSTTINARPWFNFRDGSCNRVISRWSPLSKDNNLPAPSTRTEHSVAPFGTRTPFASTSRNSICETSSPFAASFVLSATSSTRAGCPAVTRLVCTFLPSRKPTAFNSPAWNGTLQRKTPFVDSTEVFAPSDLPFKNNSTLLQLE